MNIMLTSYNLKYFYNISIIIYSVLIIILGDKDEKE